MPPKYSSTYSTARTIAAIVSFFGWILVGIGVLGVGFSLKDVVGLKQLVSGMGGIGAIVSLLASVAGLLLVASGQAVRGIVDNADNTGEILAIIKATALEAEGQAAVTIEGQSGTDRNYRHL
jgi:hypothetical protein